MSKTQAKTSVTVSTAANIALIKYWGKLEQAGNQPATASLSIGLEGLRTSTTLSFSNSDCDQVQLEGQPSRRIDDFLDLVRAQYAINARFRVVSSNNFPTGTGLASSASGFAALALGLNELLDLRLSRQEISQLARQGSGSAARSVYGGYVEVIPSDETMAVRVMPADDWPLAVIVAITNQQPKTVGSTEAMQRSATTSPYYRNWVKTHIADMAEAKLAIANRDFGKLADISEHNCLKMHGTIMTTRPPVLYWLPATIAVMHTVQSLRAAGTPAFFTIDAGAQVKVICPPEYADTIEERIRSIEGVVSTIQTEVGGEPQISSQ